MVKLQIGKPNKHVLSSRGGDVDLNKFYCTQSATTYGRKFATFEPRTTRHYGTGYLSNFRPGVYYTSHLDEIDNPVMGQIIGKNYLSITKKHYRPYDEANGKEPLPNCAFQAGSGYLRDKPLTIPTVADVRNVATMSRVASAPADIMPRGTPHLHKIRPKDPVELENHGYGPSRMTTETAQQFGCKYTGGTDCSKLSKLPIGLKEESGFVHNINEEPVTFHPGAAHAGNVPGWYTNRPTGVAITTTDYRPYADHKGDEVFPRLANRSDRNTGFTESSKSKPEFVARVMGDAYDKLENLPDAVREHIKKNDPCEYQNAIHPNNYYSMVTGLYKGQQRPSKTESDRLGNSSVGTKEISGYSENTIPFTQTYDNRARFVTHYDTRYHDYTPQGADRYGHTWGGVQTPRVDGFVRGIKMDTTTLGEHIDTTATLRRLEPYVARSIKANDTFFDDHTYDRKQQPRQTQVY